MARSLKIISAAALAVVLTAAPASADPVRDTQWHLRALKVTEAQERTKGEGIVVAVVDLAVDATHDDLAGGVLPHIGADPSFDPDREQVSGRGTALTGLI